ncbi:MAG: ATP-binding cassette domain-containing protein [Saprospiraceae bacterium]|nr:ATP-binding cassette domain-containing protein [Saprospiraceae bacterium]
MIIQAENLSAGLGTEALLHGINWLVEPNQHWVVTGANGAGKSLLINTIVGRSRIMEGSLRFPFLGEKVDFLKKKKAITRVSFTDTSKLFKSAEIQHYYQQRYNAFDADGHLTVRDYLATGGLEENNVEHQGVLQLLGLDVLIDKERIKLSSGQTRKLLLAKALIKQPKLLLLDNPYIGLDAGSREILNDTLDRLASERNISIILSGHFDVLPNCISHRLHLEQGKVSYQGPFQQLELDQVQQLTSQQKNKLKELASFYQEKSAPLQAKDVFQLDGVSVKYGQTTILDNLNWRVRPGEKWILKGQNGAGKSTLLSLLYGDNPQAYSLPVYLFDQKRGPGQSIWAIKKRIGFTSPELHAYYDQDLLARHVVWSGLTDTFHVKPGTPPEFRKITESLFEYFGISQYLNRPFSQLSTGIQRLVLFMRAVIKVPPVLLLDEPFQGFDQQLIQACRALLSQVLDSQFTLIFITHFEHEAPSIVNQTFRLES